LCGSILYRNLRTLHTWSYHSRMLAKAIRGEPTCRSRSPTLSSAIFRSIDTSMSGEKDHCRAFDKGTHQRRSARSQGVISTRLRISTREIVDTDGHCFVPVCDLRPRRGVGLDLSRSRVWRSIVLMAAGIVFLGLLSHDPMAFLPMAGFLLMGTRELQMLERGWPGSMVWCILDVILIILIYVCLKKYSLLPEGIFLHTPSGRLHHQPIAPTPSGQVRLLLWRRSATDDAGSGWRRRARPGAGC
jgi:hypothetical protein